MTVNLNGSTTFHTVTVHTETVNPGHLILRHLIPPTFNPGNKLSATLRIADF